MFLFDISVVKQSLFLESIIKIPYMGIKCVHFDPKVMFIAGFIKKSDLNNRKIIM